MNGEAGKGDTYRKTDWKKWDANYDMIFNKGKKKHGKSSNGRKGKKRNPNGNRSS